VRTRTVKTASGKHALQVVSKRHGILKVHKHIGTYGDDEEKTELLLKAQDYIKASNRQISFSDYLSSVHLSDIIVTENKPLFAYNLLSRCYDKLGLNTYDDLLIKDLIIARIYYPASKMELVEYLDESFGHAYSLKTCYRHLKQSLDNGIKEAFQTALISFAKSHLNDALHLVFYDVTTLYFESQAKTILKDFGFSKDHRPNETQIVIGLVVNGQGFPLYFDIFSGKTFEGHTFAGVIDTIRALFDSQELVVVADAAMLSIENTNYLENRGVGFVVGARLANLPGNLIDQISSTLEGKDGATTTVGYHNKRLICQYSTKRAAKDKSDRLKQIEKAKDITLHPAGISSRYRFVQKAPGNKYIINQKLIQKAEKLEGIKGYITNTALSEKTVIDRYHDLWNVERSFRITKSDLQARPIFHRLDQTIKAHMVIVFAGLAISKYIELTSGMSIKRVLKLCSKVLTHKLTNTKTGETIYTETTIEDPNIRREIEILQELGH